MKFNEDWSLAYFLYYLCIIGYWTIPAAFLIKVFIPWFSGDFSFELPQEQENVLVISEMLGILLATFFYYELSKVLKPVAEGSPFKAQTSLHLQKIAWACLIYSFLTGITHAFLWKGSEYSTLKMFELFREQFDYTFFMISLFIFVLSYVFKEGERIFEEQELTV